MTYQWQSAQESHRGNRRKNNEDSVLCRPEVPLFTVADGMGGHMAGDVASQTIADGLIAVARVTIPGFLILELTRPGGIAERHFRWPAALMGMLRRWTAIWLPFGAIGWFLVESSAGSGAG